MSDPEIRKLLGGYATNTLTESEHRALLEAALEDQELFNALQDEEALRESLADPESREQVRRALEDPQKPRASWWSSRWVWGGVATAAVAAMLVAVMMQRNPPRPAPQRAEIAALREPAKSVAAEESPAGARASKDNPAALKDLEPSQPAGKKLRALPASPAPAAAESLGQAGLSATKAEPDRKEILGAIGGAASLSQGPLLRYSVLRRDARDALSTNAPDEKVKAGDTIQLNVTPGIAGYLTVYRIGKSGESTRVFPAAGLAMPVQPNATYTVPESPITLRVDDERLRIVLAQEGGSSDRTSRLAKAPSPLIVDVPIGTN